MEGFNDLKLIKKHYNEKMAHLCRELFPTILEYPGLLYNLLKINFEPSKFLYEDIVKNNLQQGFKDYIYSKISLEQKKKEEVTKTPFELMDEAGYILYECKTEADIQKFKKYYTKGEELCTFRGDRLERCYVFFAVKKNVDEIKRENFKHPERQDLYGTSVISIQFTRDEFNTVSIKNRYNHTVDNPDATFGNNLENIIGGLTTSFNKTYGFKTDVERKDLEIPGYVRAGRKFYKYNFEFNNVYYCPNNIVIDNFEVKQYDPSRYIVFDDIILDLKEKTMTGYYTGRTRDDLINWYNDERSFCNSVGKIEKIEQHVDKETGTRTIIINDDIIITLDKFNQLIGYKNYKIKKVDDYFLSGNIALQNIEIPNVETVGECFLFKNKSLKHISLPNVKIIGDAFLYQANLNTVDLPNVEEIGNGFLRWSVVKSINFPKLKSVGEEFKPGGEKLEEVNLPELESAGSKFLESGGKFETLYLPKIKKIRDGFAYHNDSIRTLILPNLEEIGKNAFGWTTVKLKYVYAPKLNSKKKREIETNISLLNKIRYKLVKPKEVKQKIK